MMTSNKESVTASLIARNFCSMMQCANFTPHTSAQWPLWYVDNWVTLSESSFRMDNGCLGHLCELRIWSADPDYAQMRFSIIKESVVYPLSRASTNHWLVQKRVCPSYGVGQWPLWPKLRIWSVDLTNQHRKLKTARHPILWCMTVWH